MLNDNELAGIEEEFRKSWDSVQGSYLAIARGHGAYMTTFVPLIAELRDYGYDEWFRAQTSFFAFCLSRSRTSSRRWQNSFVHFKLKGDSQSLIDVNAIICWREFTIEKTKPTLSYELKALLDLLIAQPLEG